MSDADQSEEAVFEAALQLRATERAAYLDQACAGDPRLRQRIESLLGALERAGGRLSEPAVARSEAAAVHSMPPTAKPGDRIGRYKLLQQIGEGGCGVVYMAEQDQPVRRRVALKVIKLGMDTKGVIARFEAERQALALMDHPNIAKVLDAGATDTGRPYFDMELVRGIKLTDFCDENKLSTEDRIKLFIQVCQAIQHAHQKGIIHRDIKPSNILVTVNDGVPVPKVIDFGIAKATSGQQLTDKTLFTAFEQFIGTPAYMSPEQAVMTSLDIDTRSDIYSLGVLLYELLTGRTPFDQKELLAAGLDEMRRTIREKEPLKPSTRLSTIGADALTTTATQRHTDAPKLIHLLRGDLDWIVMKALDKDRTRRYETANGLARDLERHLNNEPVVARPPSNLYRFQKSVRRNKTAYAAAAAVALALLMGVIVSTSQAVRAKRAERDQVRLRQMAESKEKKSEQVTQLMQYMLNPTFFREATMLRGILDQTAERVGRDLKDLPEAEAELRGTIGDVYQLLGEYEKAEVMYGRALDLRRKLAGNEQPVVAQLLNNLGVTLMWQDKATEAEARYQEALAMRRRLRGANLLEVAETLHNLAFLLRRQGELEKAEAAISECLVIRRELLGREHRAVAESMQGLAAILWRQRKLKDAENTLREGLAMQTRLLGNGHPQVADMTEDLGNILADQGRYPEAENTLKQALAKRRTLLGDTHPDTATCIVMLLHTLLAEEKYAEAEPLARECLATRKKQMPDDSRTFNARSLLGGCLLGQKRYVEAEPLLLSGHEGMKQRESKIPWEGRYVLKDALRRIVQLYEATNQPDKAAEWKERLSNFDKTSADTKPANGKP